MKQIIISPSRLRIWGSQHIEGRSVIAHMRDDIEDESGLDLAHLERLRIAIRWRHDRDARKGRASCVRNDDRADLDPLQLRLATRHRRDLEQVQ